MADSADLSTGIAEILQHHERERLPKGSSLYEVQVHRDHRGSLTPLEGANLPFEPRRVFVVHMPQAGRPRAEHACSAEHLIVVLRGRAAFDLDDGAHRTTVELTPGMRALRLKPGIWLRMVGREPDTTLLVVASTTFAATQYYAKPQPDMLADGRTAAAADLPQADPAARFRLYEDEIAAAVRTVLRDGRLVRGPNVERFERAFARYLGVEHCIGVNSGTDALSLALRAAGVQSGDEVITVALSAAGTAQAILQCGARPRFVDVDPGTFCMDAASVEAAISPAVTAIVPVHLYGRVADMEALRRVADRHGLALVEDCAQAHGATRGGKKAGTFGHAAAFSFYPTKNLGALGDGGAVVTGDPAIAARVRALGNHGWHGRSRVSQELGFNSRLDEVQAAVLNVTLPHLDGGNIARRSLAARYRGRLAGSSVGVPTDDVGCVYHQFAVTSPHRDALRRFLGERGIGTAVHYSPPLHRHPAFACAPACDLPVTERLAATLLSLPIQPEVLGGPTDGALDRVVDAITAFGRP